MNGVALTTRSEVVKFAHTSSGMRQKVMPGSRMVMIVTRKFSAVAIEDAPANWIAMLKKVWPSGMWVESGAYAVQPVEKEPPGARKLRSMMIPPIGSSHNDSAFKRRDGMAGGPILSRIT